MHIVHPHTNKFFDNSHQHPTTTKILNTTHWEKNTMEIPPITKFCPHTFTPTDTPPKSKVHTHTTPLSHVELFYLHFTCQYYLAKPKTYISHPKKHSQYYHKDFTTIKLEFAPLFNTLFHMYNLPYTILTLNKRSLRLTKYANSSKDTTSTHHIHPNSFHKPHTNKMQHHPPY